MGDGHRSAFFDLFLEDGDHAPAAAQHVPEADDGKFGGAFGRFVQYDVFGDPFGGAHDVHRPDGFVGGDHYESFYTVFIGDMRHVPSAEDVVGYRIGTVEFHQWDMFVSRGMEHNVGVKFLKDLSQTILIANIRDLRFDR